MTWYRASFVVHFHRHLHTSPQLTQRPAGGPQRFVAGRRSRQEPAGILLAACFNRVDAIADLLRPCRSESRIFRAAHTVTCLTSQYFDPCEEQADIRQASPKEKQGNQRAENIFPLRWILLCGIFSCLGFGKDKDECIDNCHTIHKGAKNK